MAGRAAGGIKMVVRMIRRGDDHGEIDQVPRLLYVVAAKLQLLAEGGLDAV
ncbi:MAG: hypothetical protein ACC645_12595 [Pirellulales bacterium]